MSSNNKKRGAVGLYVVLMTPIILMLFSVMLDGLLTRNIKNATQRYLDVSSLAAATAAREDICAINNSHINVGVNLFNRNMASSGMSVDYAITPLRNSTQDSLGIVSYLVTGKATNLIGSLFIPFEYNYRFTVESTAVCNVK